MTDPPRGLLYAHRLDGKGGGRPMNWADVHAWTPGDGPLWVHLDRHDESARKWMNDESGLPAPIIEALLADESRPRLEREGEGLLIFLRGVNLNPGEDPEDMVSLRVWAEPHRMISLRFRRVMAVQELDRRIAAGTGPHDLGALLVALADGLVQRMGPVLNSLDEELDDLEERILTDHSSELRPVLSDIRRRAIMLRRYLSPQRDALGRLLIEDIDWIDTGQRRRLREVADRVTNYVEDLDAARERAQIVQDELSNRVAERMNRNMYVISIVATIFLPLGFVTGLFGINVAGMPGVETGWAFAAVAGGCAVLGLLALGILKLARWI